MVQKALQSVEMPKSHQKERSKRSQSTISVLLAPKKKVLCPLPEMTSNMWPLILACRKMIVAYYWGWAPGLSSLGAAESSKTVGVIDMASITRLSSGSSYAFQLQEHFRNHNRKPLQKEQTNTLMVSGGSSNPKYQGSF